MFKPFRDYPCGKIVKNETTFFSDFAYEKEVLFWAHWEKCVVCGHSFAHSHSFQGHQNPPLFLHCYKSIIYNNFFKRWATSWFNVHGGGGGGGVDAHQHTNVFEKYRKKRARFWQQGKYLVCKLSNNRVNRQKSRVCKHPETEKGDFFSECPNSFSEFVVTVCYATQTMVVQS